MLLDIDHAVRGALTRRIAALGHAPTNEALAAELGLSLAELETSLIRLHKDVDTAFRSAFKGRAEAVLALLSSVLNSQRQQVVDIAAKNRLPVIYPFAEFVEAGGLASYGVSYTDLYRRTATYIDKILKGSKPADLPVEQPTRFEFVINLKTAK